MILEELVVCYSWNFGIFVDRFKDLNMMGKFARLWILSSDAFSTISLTSFWSNCVPKKGALLRFASISFGIHQKNSYKFVCDNKVTKKCIREIIPSKG